LDGKISSVSRPYYMYRILIKKRPGARRPKSAALLEAVLMLCLTGVCLK